ncbi:MAG TPA: HipA N-terminal domain-containing protein [bacterium]|nr:HipA N-terminal domain-containing protein [bacterium]
MRSCRILVHGRPAAVLEEVERDRRYVIRYQADYDGPPVSLTLPVDGGPFAFSRFPPFFDGLLPEGVQLEALLRQSKIDASDYFRQLTAVGSDLVGAVTVEPIE